MAREIARILEADIDEIYDEQNRKGVVDGWLIAGRDATLEKEASIKFNKNPREYDLVVVGTPIWAFTLTPSIRSYLMANKGKFKKLAFFSTSAGAGIKRTFEEMEKLSHKPVATLALKSKAWSVRLHLDEDNNMKKISNFCDEIKKQLLHEAKK